MTDRVHASMKRMKLTPGHTLSNSIRTQPHRAELPDRHHTLLAPGQLGDRSFPLPSPLPNRKFRDHRSPKFAFGIGAPPTLG